VAIGAAVIRCHRLQKLKPSDSEVPVGMRLRSFSEDESEEKGIDIKFCIFDSSGIPTVIWSGRISAQAR
jgi:hypothetical protein